MLIGLLVLAGCTGRSLISWGSGWSATAASDGVLFVGNKQGEVLAFEAITGDSPREKWRFPREGEEKLGGVFGMPAVGEELLFIADKGDREGKGGRLFAIGKESGARQWVKGIEGGIVGGPALSESHGLVMVGSDDGSLYAFHTAGGCSGAYGVALRQRRQDLVHACRWGRGGLLRLHGPPHLCPLPG